SAVRADGRQTLRALRGGDVELWDVDRETVVCRLPLPIPPHARDFNGEGRLVDPAEYGVRSLTFSPDGAWIVTAGADDVVRVWSSKNGSQIWAQPEDAPIRCADFTADGRFVAVNRADKQNAEFGVLGVLVSPGQDPKIGETIRLRDVTTGT